MKTPLQKIKAFTLIELLIVMAIIGILSGLILPNLQGMRARARDTRRKADLGAISKAVLMFNNNIGQYPAHTTGASPYRIQGCDNRSAPLACAWGSAFNDGVSTYMTILPLDPSSTSSSNIYYQYYYDSTNFVIVAELENLSDPGIASSQTKCASIYALFDGGGGATTNSDYVVCN